jgi:hypothetical protein
MIIGNQYKHSFMMLWSKESKPRSKCLERHGSSKLLSLIRAAERFRPLNKFTGVESVWKIETGLKRGLLLPRKQRITIQGAHAEAQYIVSFSPLFLMFSPPICTFSRHSPLFSPHPPLPCNYVRPSTKSAVSTVWAVFGKK